MNLLNNFVIKGKWWIPDDKGKEKEKYFGELSYNKPDKIELILEGSFFNTNSIYKARHNFTIPAIHGLSRDGKFITLINTKGNELGRNEWIYTELSADYFLINQSGHFGISDMGVSTVNFSTNFFHSFFNHLNNFARHDFVNSKMSFAFDEDKSIEVIDNEQLNVYFFFSRGFKGLGDEEITINQKVYLNIEFKEHILLSNVNEKVNYYKDFFAFLCSPVICFESINVFAPDIKKDNVNFNLVPRQTVKQIGANVRPFDVLLNYEEISHNLEELLLSWVNNEEQNKSLLALYMQLNYLYFPSDIQYFLNIVFALETLHNTFFDYTVFDDAELKTFKEEKKKAVKEIFSQKFKSKLDECLGHFSSPSFSLRLKDLISRNEIFIKEYITDAPDFIRIVSRQRNYLAHNHLETEKATINPNEYKYYTAVLKMLFECSFLKQLGFEDKQIQLIIKRNFNYDLQKKKVSEAKGL